MLKITSIDIKETKNGVEYKTLHSDNGERVNMWIDDPDYERAEAGVILDREIISEETYPRLSEPKPKEAIKNEDLSYNERIEKKIDAIYWVQMEMAKKIGMKTLADYDSRPNLDHLLEIPDGEIPF